MTEGELRVRPGRPGDAEAIAELIAVLGRPIASPPTGRQRRVLLAHMDAPDRMVLVAERSGAVLGFASLTLRERLGWESREAWIGDLCVAPAARRAGVAAALVAACRDLAEEEGCHLVRLECGHDRGGAHDLYRGLGFRDGGVSYQLPLPGERGPSR